MLEYSIRPICHGFTIILSLSTDLKGFTDLSSPESIYVYERGCESPFQTQVKSIGNEVGLYPNELEAMLANDIEQAANPSLEKLRNLQEISEGERLPLARYMFAMWLRVPKQRNSMVEKSPEILSTTFERIRERLEEAALKHPDKLDIIQQRLQQLQEARANLPDDIAKEMWTNRISIAVDGRVVQTMMKMEWRCLVAAGEQPFVTSDNPYFLFPAIGIGKPNSEITFPLGRDIALWAKWKMPRRAGFHVARTQFVKEINRRTISSALRYVYSSVHADWISNLMNKKYLHFSRFI